MQLVPCPRREMINQANGVIVVSRSREAITHASSLLFGSRKTNWTVLVLMSEDDPDIATLNSIGKRSGFEVVAGGVASEQVPRTYSRIAPQIRGVVRKMLACSNVDVVVTHNRWSFNEDAIHWHVYNVVATLGRQLTVYCFGENSERANVERRYGHAVRLARQAACKEMALDRRQSRESFHPMFVDCDEYPDLRSVVLHGQVLQYPEKN